ncbi:MAG: MFS transporter [Nitrososphaerales archaeon]
MDDTTATHDVEEEDRLSLAILLTSRILRSISAGAINLVFAYLVLVDMKQGFLILGSIYTVALLSTAILGLAIGFGADLLGRKTAYVISLVLLPISTLMIYFSQNLIVVFIAAAVGGYSATGSLAGGGVGGAAASVQSAIITDLTPRLRRTFYYSFFTFIAGIAAAIGAYAAGFFGIQAVFVICTVLSSTSAIVSLFIRIPHVDRAKATVKMKTGRAIGKFGITGILNGLSNGLVTPFFIPFFISVYDIQRNQMNEYAAISGLIASVSLLLSTRVERKLGFLRGMITTRGMSLVLALMFPFLRFLPFSLVVYFAFPATRVVALPIQQTAMMDMVDRNERGRAFGINQSARLLASGGGTELAGYEFELSFVEVPFVLYAVLMGANLYLYSRFFSRYDKETSQ